MPNFLNIPMPIFFFLIAIVEEAIFRILPYYFFTGFNIPIYVYVVVSSILYALSHKILFSWKMVAVTLFLGVLFSSLIIIDVRLVALTVMLHYIAILLNTKFLWIK